MTKNTTEKRTSFAVDYADAFDELKSHLTEDVPVRVKSSIPNSPTTDEVIDEYNTNTANTSNDACLAVIWSFINNEKERTKRQKPLLYIVVSLTVFQLVIFNIIIGAITWFSFKNGEEDVLYQLFVIIKYYIGATVAELIGMIWFVTKGTFSSNHFKTMELMLADRGTK